MSNKKVEKNELIRQVNESSRKVSTETVLFHQAVAEKAGLSGADHKYVDLLFQHGPMTAGAFSELSGLTTGAVTGVIDRLEEQGLVKRERNPDDRRQVLVVLDKEEAMRRIGPAFQNMATGLDKLYEEFSLEEMLVIKRYLQRTIDFYHQQIEEMNKSK